MSVFKKSTNLFTFRFFLFFYLFPVEIEERVDQDARKLREMSILLQKYLWLILLYRETTLGNSRKLKWLIKRIHSWAVLFIYLFILSAVYFKDLSFYLFYYTCRPFLMAYLLFYFHDKPILNYSSFNIMFVVYLLILFIKICILELPFCW